MNRKLVTVHGLATRFGVIFRPEVNGKDAGRTKFSPSAFGAWLSSPASQLSQLQVMHKENWRIRTVGPLTFRTSKQGLHVNAIVREKDYITRGALLAIRHGWLNELSVSFSIHKFVRLRDSEGPYRYVTEASVAETSAVDKGACCGTWLNLRGESGKPDRRRPKSAEDVRALNVFLALINHRNWEQAKTFRNPKPMRSLPELIQSGCVVMADELCPFTPLFPDSKPLGSAAAMFPFIQIERRR